MNDEELIAALANGNAKAFEQLYLRYHKKIFSLCFHYLQQKEEAEETMQDVFLKVHHAANKYQSHSTAATWLYRITVNKCLDKLRYRNAKKRITLFTQFFEDKADSADELRYNDKLTNDLYVAINKLSDNQKSAIILTYMHELSVKETAAIMNISAKATESLLQRAKVNLKKNLKKN